MNKIQTIISNKDKLAKQLLDKGLLTVNRRLGTVKSHLGRTFSHVNKYGYVVVSYRIGSKKTVFQAHRIVCIACHGIVKNQYKLQVNHKDGDKQNNRPSNLEWVTPHENTTHAIVTGLRTSFGQHHANAVYNEKQVKQVFGLLADGKLTHKAIAERLSMTRSVVSLIACGKLWNHLRPQNLVLYADKLHDHKTRHVQAYERFSSKLITNDVNSTCTSILYSLKHKLLDIEWNGKNRLPRIVAVDGVGRRRHLGGCKTKFGYVTNIGEAYGRKHQAYLHQIVAVAYLGLPPPKKRHVKFLDGNKFNYAPNNICWAT